MSHRRLLKFFCEIQNSFRIPNSLPNLFPIIAELGYLTIHLKTVTFNTISGADLDFQSKVQLFIDGKEVLKKTSHQNTASFNIDSTYKSGKISKETKIKIAVRAHDSTYATVLEHQGTVESLLKDPVYHTDKTTPLSVKSIELEAFWQGEH